MNSDRRAVGIRARSPSGPWDVRLNGFLELRGHCATLRELCVQSGCGYQGNVALCLFACECNLPILAAVDSLPVFLWSGLASSWTWCVGVLCETGPLGDKRTCWPGGTSGRCMIVLRDVVDSYLFRMHTFHVTSHCIIGPTGSSMNKHQHIPYWNGDLSRAFIVGGVGENVNFAFVCNISLKSSVFRIKWPPNANMVMTTCVPT